MSFYTERVPRTTDGTARLRSEVSQFYNFCVIRMSHPLVVDLGEGRSLHRDREPGGLEGVFLIS